jgi:hypothetical protein
MPFPASAFGYVAPDGGATAYGPLGAPSIYAHYVGTYDGKTATLYVNGSPNTAPTSAFISMAASSFNNIGRGSAGAGTYFPGVIDEVAVYGTALSNSQVLSHYAIGLGAR